MNPKAIDGILLLLAFAAIVSGVAVKWGTGWALICAGSLVIARVAAPYVHVLLLTRRERSDA
jgi:hypothetical protein